MEEKITLENYVAYGVSALKERKAYFVNALQTTTNPLDKLSYKDKIEELDVCIKYFQDYADKA